MIVETPRQTVAATAHPAPRVPDAAHAVVAAAVGSPAAPKRRAAGEADAIATPAAPATTTTAPDVDAMYLPRAALTTPPRPIEPVVIDFPSFAGEADRYVGEFEVFVDDTGGVVRVRNAGQPLPPILVDAVSAAFLPARFTPGEVDGQPVRSRLRIEVTFDTQRPPA